MEKETGEWEERKNREIYQEILDPSLKRWLFISSPIFQVSVKKVTEVGPVLILLPKYCLDLD